MAGELQRLVQTIGRNNARAVLAASVILEGGIKAKLSQAGSGRMYRRRSHRGKLHRDARARLRGFQGPLRKKAATQLHQASAAGEPPAPDEGILRASIGTQVLADKTRVGSSLAVIPVVLNHGSEIARKHGFSRLSAVEAAVKRRAARFERAPLRIPNRGQKGVTKLSAVERAIQRRDTHRKAGTSPGGLTRIAARPFMEPAFEASKDAMTEAAVQAYRSGLGG